MTDVQKRYNKIELFVELARYRKPDAHNMFQKKKKKKI